MSTSQRVAIIGAGAGGLAAARWLTSEGFAPVLFEASSTAGGQWGGDPKVSAIWPTMRTNTSRVLTQFSDLPHRAGLPAFPSNREIGAYLSRYIDHFDLREKIQLRTPVSEVRAVRGGYAVRYGEREEVFEKVVVAVGRFQHGWTPDVPGLASFTGSAGAIHAKDYKEPERYRGKRVLVAGGAITALEIASDLAALGAQVVLSSRRHRYVMPKIVAGVPSDHRMFTRYQVLAEETLPRPEFGALTKAQVLDWWGSPDQYGAPKPAAALGEAGLTVSQHFLPMVAEGRIEVRPWLDRVDGANVTFSDGQVEEFDGILFGTGFDLRLPFLSEEIRRTVKLAQESIELYRHTFHPELPGLAFMGLWDQGGPFLPPLELQARWLAYAWSGAVAAPTANEMAAAISEGYELGAEPQKTKMNLVTLLFARAAGVEPEPHRWPELKRALLFGPLVPVSFRLQGRDALRDAAARVAEETAAFGSIESPEFTELELGKVRKLADRPHSARVEAWASAVLR